MLRYALVLLSAAPAYGGDLIGTVVDAESQQPIAARVYVQSQSGEYFHVESAHEDGSAVPYRKARSPVSTEVHTAVSAHPFKVKLAPGQYTVTIERGKQYVPQTKTVEVGQDDTQITIPLRRWINLNDAGWYSGETHVHRTVDELPTAMLADDLNVALPLSYWVTRAYTAPTQGNKNAAPAKPELIRVDDTHVIYPMNTEYEIFTVDGKRHTLGAVFALNHRTVFDQGVPPVAPIARRVHEEGGLLELDKHNWPWSMMLVPVMNVDLYELTNNHIWRAPFHFYGFGESPPNYMKIEKRNDGVSEVGWIDFTHRNYYALLNCGFRMRPTAGTASGVHPVPLGFGRVFVYLPEPFSYEGWIKGLDEGRSFVTTGPLMSITVNDQLPGHTFKVKEGSTMSVDLQGWARSLNKLKRIEVIVNGQIIRAIEPENRELEKGGFDSPISMGLAMQSSGWLAVRCFSETPDGRPRFAHSAPFHVDIPNKPLRPRAVEVAYFVRRMEEEIARHEGVLKKDAIEEYRRALEIWKSKIE